jgi:hypothetical protein
MLWFRSVLGERLRLKENKNGMVRTVHQGLRQDTASLIGSLKEQGVGSNGEKRNGLTQKGVTIYQQ